MAKYRCPNPECRSADDLGVTVITSANLIQDADGNLSTEVNGDHEWDDQSTMWCTNCGTSETASSFQSGEDSDE